jgi:hypothetical protein
MITVLMTLVTPVPVVPMSDILIRGVLIIPLVPLIHVILMPVNVYMNILNVAMTTNVPKTVAIVS